MSSQKITTSLLGKKVCYTIKQKEEVNGIPKWLDVTEIGEIVAVTTDIRKSMHTAEIDFYFLLKLKDRRTVTKRHVDCKIIE